MPFAGQHPDETRWQVVAKLHGRPTGLPLPSVVRRHEENLCDNLLMAACEMKMGPPVTQTKGGDSSDRHEAGTPAVFWQYHVGQKSLWTSS